jgi:aminoglycoside phosphotransferase (APT) family kinase protein
MPHPWIAEHEVSPEHARALIEKNFTDLRVERIEYFGEGWDNTAFLVNGALVFRFPRRAIAVPSLAVETALLPHLVPRLPLAVPDPRWVGAPDDSYPWPFAGYRLLPGRTVLRSEPRASVRAGLAVPLGTFLRALHAIPLVEAEQWGAPTDEFARLDMARRGPKVRDGLEALVGLNVIDSPHPWRALIDAAAAVPNRRLTLVHGDFHPDQILVHEGELSGVIDWGDAHRGHPAVDVSIAWTMLPRSALPAFLDAYGGADEATLALARFRALDVALQAHAYARDRDDTELLTEALRILDELRGDVALS